MSTVFISYGLCIIIAVLMHFKEAKIYCDSVRLIRKDLAYYLYNSNETEYYFDNEIGTLLKDNSELFLWDHCQFKVYPFDLNGHHENDICQCRNFQVDWWQDDKSAVEQYVDGLYLEDVEIVFDVDINEVLMNIFRKWYMLERIMIVYDDYISTDLNWTVINLENDMFDAKRMQAVHIDGVFMNNITNSISNWKNLVYLQLINNFNISSFPPTINQLTHLQYLYFGESHKFETFQTELCDLDSLIYLRFTGTCIEKLPFCIDSLVNLRSFIAWNSFWFADSQIPISLFELPKLEELLLDFAPLQWEPFFVYNNLINSSGNITSDTFIEFDSIFSRNFLFSKSLSKVN